MTLLASSLRGRLMLLMLAAAIPAFAMIAYFTYWLRAHELQRYQDELLTLAQTLADKQQRHLNHALLLLASIEHMPKARDPYSCEKTLTEVMALARPHVTNLFVIRPDGKIACGVGASASNVADMPWFRSTLKATAFNVGTSPISLKAGNPSLILSHALREHGRVVAVYAAILDLSVPEAQPNLSRLSFLYAVFDNRGTSLLCQPASALIGQDFVGHAFQRSLAGLPGPALFHDRGDDAVTRLFAYAPLGPAHNPYARLVVGVSTAELDAPAREIILIGLAGLAAAMGLGLLAGWFGGEWLVLKPLRPVLESVQRVASGDLSVRTPHDPKRDDEISRLATEVDRMAVALSQRDQALTEARDRAQAYLDIVGVMVLVINGKGNIVLSNLETRKVLGSEASEPEGNWVENWVAPDERAQGKELFARLLAGDRSAGSFHELHVRTTKGKQRLIAWRHTPLRDKRGSIMGVLCAGEDITEKKRLEADEEQLRTQLQQAQKMEALGQLSGGIAHDFNNILTAVLGFAKLALRRHAPDPDSELAEYLREVIGAGERARDLVAQMLAYSRTQPGHTERALAPEPLVKEMVKMLSVAIPAGIRTRFGEDLPLIAIDPVSFHQILMNLVINARDASEGGDHVGHISIGLSRQQVDGRICSDCHEYFSGDYLELRVSDDGQGIPAEILPRIFEPFFTTKEVGKGSGMGLAMVHGLVRRAGGHFQVDSAPGLGTSFCIYFPAYTLAAVNEPAL